MNADNITQGKWEVYIQPAHNGTVRTINVGSKRIATLSFMPTIEESEANAKAIAALPETLKENESLKALNAELLEAGKYFYGILSEDGYPNESNNIEKYWNGILKKAELPLKP